MSLPLLELVHRTAARGLVRLWPFPFAHIRLLALLDPPSPQQDRTTTKLRGFPLSLTYDPRTYIGRYLYFRGMYEEQVIKKLAHLLKSNMTFLDVGANIGLHTVVAAHRVGPSGRVLSVEPQRRVCERLRANISLNRLDNVDVFTCALGRQAEARQLFQISARNDGQATLALGPEERFCAAESVDVQPLEALAGEAGISHIDGVKIDVEGAEMDVLLGAHSYFQSTGWPGFMLIECVDQYLSRFGSNSIALVDFLRQAGYQIFSLHRGHWEPDPEPKGLQADLLALRRT